jgi:hypothetical protein
MNTIRLWYPIPYYAQVASPELAYAIFEEGLDPRSDPRWQQWGCASAAEYAYWVDRACGIACVKMVVEGLGGPQNLMMEWIQDALRRNGYLVTADANGNPVERGWVHRVLADLISACGFPASARPATMEEIAGFLDGGQIVIASVSYELGRDGPITHQGGHLVVVTGADVTDAGGVECFSINNPSGRLAKYQVNARIDAGRFAQAYSGRVILTGISNPLPLIA